MVWVLLVEEKRVKKSKECNYLCSGLDFCLFTNEQIMYVYISFVPNVKEGIFDV